MIRIAQTTVAAIAVVGLSSVLLSSCGGERANDPIQTGSESLDLAQSAFINDQMLPDIKRLVQSSITFETSTQTFCNTVNTANLSAMQTNWKAMASDWSRVEQYSFGPFNDDLF